MDTKINKLKKEYEKLKQEKPNIIKANERVLNFYIEKLEKTIIECENSLQHIKSSERDLTQKEIACILLFRRLC